MSDNATRTPWAVHAFSQYRDYDHHGRGVGSPLPWAIVPATDLGKHAGGFASDPLIDKAEFAQVICYLFYARSTDEEVSANAEFIVRAVNSHDKLLAACRTAARIADMAGMQTWTAAERKQLAEAIRGAEVQP